MARPALIPAVAIGGERGEPVEVTPARFDGWYEQLRGPLRSYLRRVAESSACADDLFQETWIRLLTHPPRTLDPAAVRAYVFTIATHLARDAWRRRTWIGRFIGAPRRWREGSEAREDPLHLVPDRAPPPDERHATREEVVRSLASLTARERALLWLAHVERYDHREIAAMLDLRPASVRVLLHRARRRALAALGGTETARGGTP